MCKEIKPLTLEETMLKEEIKSRCLNKGQYIDEKAKDKFKMLCHLEDFEIQYFNLQQENQQLKEQLEEKIYLGEEEILNKFFEEYPDGDKELNKYKSVLDEIREYIEDEDFYECSYEDIYYNVREILDKVKE